MYVHLFAEEEEEEEGKAQAEKIACKNSLGFNS